MSPEDNGFNDIVNRFLQDNPRNPKNLFRQTSVLDIDAMDFNAKIIDEDESTGFDVDLRILAAISAVGRLWVKNRDESDESDAMEQDF